MATETNLTKVNVFPNEETYNTNKDNLGSGELSLVKVQGIINGSIINSQEPDIIQGRESGGEYKAYGKMWSWYRVHGDGWVEQGGHFERESGNNSKEQTITLPIPMRDTYYLVLLTKEGESFWYRDNVHLVYDKTTSNFKYQSTTEQGSKGYTMYSPTNWYVAGYKA